MRGGFSAAAAALLVAGGRWEAGRTTRAEARCGCFLPDLTGLARRPSAADLPGSAYHAFGGRGQGAKRTVRDLFPHLPTALPAAQANLAAFAR